jgi:hypothetical protein
VQVVIVTAVDDVVDDGDVIVPVTFSVVDALSDDDFDPLPNQVVTVTTIDNDGAEFVLAGTAGLTVSEVGGSPAIFTVVLSTQPQAPVRLTITSGDLGEVTVFPPSVTFLPTGGDWSEPQTITLSGVDDSIDDGDEFTTITVRVDTLQSSPEYRALAPKTVTVTTLDDDAATVTLSANPLSISESGGSSIVTATLSIPSDTTVTVNLGFAGSATLTSDYTRSGTAIVIPPLSTSGTMTINAVNDAIDEPNETVIVDIASVINATESGTQQVTVTIVDDDPAPSISINDVTLAEGNPPGTTVFGFIVSLSGASGQTVTVNYATADGSATTADGDYTAIGSTLLTFTPGQTSQPVDVTVQRDTKFELDEPVAVYLSSPSTA